MTNQLPEDWFAIGMCDYGGGAWYSNAMGYSGGIGYLEIEEPPTSVYLVSFTASPNFDFVELNWKTELEVDNLQWLIERKEENGEFKIIATLPGHHTTPEPSYYSYRDNDVKHNNVYYYRLTDVSTSGHKNIHKPILVRIPSIEGKRLSVTPTMFKQNLSIEVRGLNGESGNLTIFDKSGRSIKTVNLSGSESPLTIKWNGMNKQGKKVNSGVYFIRLTTSDSKTETKKVVFIK